MLKINREKLLHAMEWLRPGLTGKDANEQSSCMVFQEGRVATFNGEVACRAPSPFKDLVTGAIPAKKLLDNLPKWKEKLVDVKVNGGVLLVKGKGKYSRIPIQEPRLQLDLLEEPTKWFKVDPKMLDGIRGCAAVAGKHGSAFEATCVRITPEFMESSDGTQMIRYKARSPVKEPTLITAETLKHAAKMDSTAVSDTLSWIHFRNQLGLIYSVRKFMMKYPDLDSVVKNTKGGGVSATLPKGLEESAERAAIYSNENRWGNKILVEIRDGKIYVKGRSDQGEHVEFRRFEFSGNPVQFLIHPEMLSGIVKRYTDCRLNERRLCVDGDGFIYIAVLTRVPEANGEAPKPMEE